MAARKNADEGTTRTAIPANDAWTGMLAVSLTALVAACVLLFLDYSQYSGKPSNPGSFSPPSLEEPAAEKAEGPGEGGQQPEGKQKDDEGGKKGP